MQSENSTSRWNRSNALIVLSILLLAVLCCLFNGFWKDALFATVKKSQHTAELPEDPLRDVLELLSNGDANSAVDTFVATAPINWIETTSLEEFKISEADFMSLGTSWFTRYKQPPLQQKFIERVGQLKQIARIARDRAIASASRGDEKSANDYILAINRLGEQLRNSNTVTVFQQTGMALERFQIEK